MPDRFLFAPEDKKIPVGLKVRIGGWKHQTPSSQFQQYGPINKYLQLKFSRATHMVKPQPLFRQPLEEDDDDLLTRYGSSNPKPALTDEESERLDDLLDELDAGNISFDSTHAGYFRRSATAGEKHYPDFAVCEHFDKVTDPLPSEAQANTAEHKDVVRVIVEIASVPRKAMSQTRLDTLKLKTLNQLLNYMTDLGPDGDRWKDNVLGIALVGTEVAFIVPERNGLSTEWVADRGPDGQGDVWDSLYGDKFQSWINTAVEYGKPATSRGRATRASTRTRARARG